MNVPPGNQGPSHPDDPSNPEFLKQFEETIQSFAEATEAGHREEATAAAFSALMMAAEEAMQNPTPEITLAVEASHCEERGDWPGAERTYRELLALRQTSGNPGLVAKPWLDLSRLLRLQGRLDQAWECALKATASARLADISPLTAQALENQSICARQRGDLPEALEAASAALAVLEPNLIMASMRANALVVRAECRLACADVAGAETDLESSWELVDPEKFPPTLPGYIGGLANWWDVRAKLERHRGRWPLAAEAVTRAVSYRRQRLDGPPSPYVFLALARDLELCAEISARCGQAQAAAEAAEEARSLRAEHHLPVADPV